VVEIHTRHSNGLCTLLLVMEVSLAVSSMFKPGSVLTGVESSKTTCLRNDVLVRVIIVCGSLLIKGHCSTVGHMTASSTDTINTHSICRSLHFNFTSRYRIRGSLGLMNCVKVLAHTEDLVNMQGRKMTPPLPCLLRTRAFHQARTLLSVEVQAAA
jgi:hypothetical protein